MKDKFPPLLMMTFVTLALVIITTPILVPNVLATLPGRNGKIVFQRGWPDTQIWVVNADGTGQHTPLTYGIESVVDFGPCWSPDGMKIAFERGIDFGGHYICIMDQDGTLTQITDGNGFDRFPDWQPLPR